MVLNWKSTANCTYEAGLTFHYSGAVSTDRSPVLEVFFLYGIHMELGSISSQQNSALSYICNLALLLAETELELQLSQVCLEIVILKSWWLHDHIAFLSDLLLISNNQTSWLISIKLENEA